MKIDSADILIILCGDDVEKDCVDFYKENHYILKSCENYRDKLLKLEFIEDNE